MMVDLSDKRVKLGLGLGLIILGAVIFWNLTGNKKTEEKISPEITLESSKMMAGQEALKSPMTEAEKQEIEASFVEQGAEMTMLKDVAGGQAVGTAWRSFSENKFVHKVEASRLPSLEKGFYYEGWLVSDQGFFSTGRVSVELGEGRLYYQTEGDKNEFRGVVITLEAEDGNLEPDKHILEGSF